MEARLRVGVLVLAVALTLVVEGAWSSPDGDVLTSLRSSLSDPDSALESWDPTLVDPCTWFHVTCNSDNRVTRLDLPEDNLSGPLVSGLGSLDQLQYLVLSGNSLNGSIPAELGNLKNLVALDLYENTLSGSIPSSLGSNLQALRFLRLADNKLSGQIPKELGSIPNLTILNISTNNFCGTVPPELSRIPYVDVSNNPGLGSPCP